ncbi:type IV secretory system conjugative DNA transfer family protein [Myroides odoratimimus]|uniref:type IV secretory system conjugative DNA transfer family protein n=1 Tax=Myroides odoratimimus TaxID=76832 RepID=UPI002576EA74|nr:type IV secretory system conjugative DNA transfer family protein [Myroides odoratimimus]MDM1514364.1 type IV secretory system conjugative DNA transfer family protein [Myroides odoratimimus]
MKELKFDTQKKGGGCLKFILILIVVNVVLGFFLTSKQTKIIHIILGCIVCYLALFLYKKFKGKLFKKVSISSVSNSKNSNGISINGVTIIENPYAGVFISGGAGSGKSKSLVEPIIKQAGIKEYTGVIYDFKFPELAQYVNTAYENSSVKPFYINFTDLNRSHRINPIAPELMRNESYAREFAYTILANLNPQMISKPDFWSDNSTSLLTAIFWYLKVEQPNYCTLPHAISMVLQPDITALFRTLSRNSKCADMIAPIMTAYERGAEDQLAGVISSLQVSLSKINSNEIYYVMSGSDFSLELNNSDKKGILVVGNDPTLASTYAPVIGLILTSVSKQLNRQDKEKSMFLMDEFPTIYVPNIEQLPATARSNKVATILACQDISQMVDKYGKDKTDTILSNLGNQFYGRTPNPQTAKRVSEMFGKEEKQVVSQNVKTSIVDLHNSSTYSTRETDRVKTQDVANLDTGSFFTVLSEGKSRQGLSNIPMDKKFIKTYPPEQPHIS